jgi:dihydrofolate reductase
MNLIGGSMGRVFIHATITLDGFMAGAGGDMSWMQDLEAADEDYAVVDKVTSRIGAIVGGSNKTNTIEEDGIPYGGAAKVPVFLMTHEVADPIEKDGITYTFVVDDIQQAVERAKEAAGDKDVSLLGGSISRQCLKLGLVDEIILDVEPLLLGEGISLFDGLGETIKLKRLETSAFASETHLRFAVVK